MTLVHLTCCSGTVCSARKLNLSERNPDGREKAEFSSDIKITFNIEPLAYFISFSLETYNFLIIFIFQLSSIIKCYFRECKCKQSIYMADFFIIEVEALFPNSYWIQIPVWSLYPKHFLDFNFETSFPSCHSNLISKLLSDHLFEWESWIRMRNLKLNKNLETKFWI